MQLSMLLDTCAVHMRQVCNSVQYRGSARAAHVIATAVRTPAKIRTFCRWFDERTTNTIRILHEQVHRVFNFNKLCSALILKRVQVKVSVIDVVWKGLFNRCSKKTTHFSWRRVAKLFQAVQEVVPFMKKVQLSSPRSLEANNPQLFLQNIMILLNWKSKNVIVADAWAHILHAGFSECK